MPQSQSLLKDNRYQCSGNKLICLIVESITSASFYPRCRPLGSHGVLSFTHRLSATDRSVARFTIRSHCLFVFTPMSGIVDYIGDNTSEQKELRDRYVSAPVLVHGPEPIWVKQKWTYRVNTYSSLLYDARGKCVAQIIRWSTLEKLIFKITLHFSLPRRPYGILEWAYSSRYD